MTTPGNTGAALGFGAEAKPGGNTAQGGVYVPHACPRAVAEGARR